LDNQMKCCNHFFIIDLYFGYDIELMGFSSEYML